MRPVLFLIALTVVTAPIAIQPQANADIRDNALLSRPLTVMEHILVRLQRWAEDRASAMARPDYSSRYKPAPSFGASARVGIDHASGRIVSETTVHIQSIDDPWKEVCVEMLNHISRRYGIGGQDQVWAIGPAHVLFDLIQASSENKIETYLQMMQSIFVRLVFFQTDGKQYHQRICEYDAIHDQYKFSEVRDAKVEHLDPAR